MKTSYSRLMVGLVVLLLTIVVFQPPTLGNPKTKDSKNELIAVRLILDSKSRTIRVGQTLEVRVEIQNVGTGQLFIEKAIYELCGPSSPLSLRLELGPQMKPYEGGGCASDCAFVAKDTFAKRLVSHWTSLPPGNFYGTVVTIHPDSFPQLKTPGRWRLSGTYKSMGGLSSEFCFDTAPLPDQKEQIKALPYEAWQGEVDTNAIWIEVLGAESSKVKK